MPDIADKTNAQEQELLLAMHGGLKGRLAREFCVVQGGIDSLHRFLEQNTPSATWEHAAAILDALQARLLVLERLADNAADIALGGALRAPQTAGPVELVAYLRGLQGHAGRELARLGYPARIELQAQGELYLSADEGLMNVLFVNLLSNSVCARADTVITLSVDEQRHLLYRDTGPGLPSADWALLHGRLETEAQLRSGHTGLLAAAACAASLGWTLGPGPQGPGFALEVDLGSSITAPAALELGSPVDRTDDLTAILRREFAAALPPR